MINYDILNNKFNENGFVIFRELIKNKGLLDFVGVYAYNKARIDGHKCDDPDVPGSASFYGDHVM